MFGSEKINLSIVSKDKVSVARIKKELHTRTDISIETFKNGEQFLGSIYQHTASMQNMPIVLLDSKLKSREFEDSRDGIEILHEITSLHKNYGVIMLVDPNEKKLKNEALKAGAYACIVKNEHMLIRITNYLENLISTKRFTKEKNLNRLSLIVFGSTLLVFTLVAFYLFKHNM